MTILPFSKLNLTVCESEPIAEETNLCLCKALYLILIANVIKKLADKTSNAGTKY